MNRRRVRRYRNQRGNSGVKFLGIIGIMVVAVICGYLTARFIIAPLLGYDTEVLKLDFPSNFLEVFREDDGKTQGAEQSGIEAAESSVQKDETEKVEAKKDRQKEGTAKETGEKGYALQFGLFSTESRAEELTDKLKQEGLDAEIIKTEGQFKVISPVVKTKEEALENLKNTESKHVPDIFITTV